MIAIAAYMIKAILMSGAFYTYYHVFLKNKHFHAFNRYFLLAVVAISAIFPLVNWEWQYTTIDNSPLNALAQKAGTGVETFSSSLLATSSWVLVFYGLISFLFLVLLGFRIRWVYRIKKLSKCMQADGFTLVETNVKGAPFSFLDNLFWKQGLSLTDANGEKVFKHELTHIRQRHTYDRLFVQIMASLFWINPFYWFLQKELVTVHEFIADEVAVGNCDTEAFATMLLYTHSNGSYLSPTHHFFNSQIKRRLIMISSSKTTSYAWLRKVLVVPVAFAVIFAVSLNSKAQTAPNPGSSIAGVTTDTIPKKSQEITVVGYSKKKGKRPATPPASQESLKPITVTGKKIEKKGDAKKEVKKSF